MTPKWYVCGPLRLGSVIFSDPSSDYAYKVKSYTGQAIGDPSRDYAYKVKFYTNQAIGVNVLNTLLPPPTYSFKHISRHETQNLPSLLTLSTRLPSNSSSHIIAKFHLTTTVSRKQSDRIHHKRRLARLQHVNSITPLNETIPINTLLHEHAKRIWNNIGNMHPQLCLSPHIPTRVSSLEGSEKITEPNLSGTHTYHFGVNVLKRFTDACSIMHPSEVRGTDIIAAKAAVPLHLPLSSIGGLGITEENSQPADPIPVKMPSRNFKTAARAAVNGQAQIYHNNYGERSRALPHSGRVPSPVSQAGSRVLPHSRRYPHHSAKLEVGCIRVTGGYPHHSA
ncbi:hypothetical protein FHG87_010479 [Trinorchestia longiramus]|nr:hypothetical protein FHG87_010479 [Trinorchestia longiramus]